MAQSILKVQGIPALGLGTFEASPDEPDKCSQAVKAAIEAGYRHIDTAAFYGCEEQVGRGIAASDVDRADLVVCTKFWQEYHQPEDVEKSLNESLARLGLSYVDLFLMHWPLAFKRDADYNAILHPDGKPLIDEDLSTNHEPTWRAMEALVRQGKAKAIGVSNFRTDQLERLLSFAEIKPACNQVEAHPWFPQNDLLRFCHKHDIAFVAYSPLGSQPGAMHTVKAKLLDDEDVVAVAKRLSIDPAQVLISWAIQRGTVAIPKSGSPSRIRRNAKVYNLDASDFDLINEITVRHPEKLNRFVTFDSIWGVSQFSTDTCEL